MYMLFLICAVVGGTVLLFQFVLSIVGIGGDEFAGDMPDDVDLPVDIAAVSGGMEIDGSTWLFGALSFRTVVAALTFFGIGGMASLDMRLSQPLSLIVAVGAGASALYVVHYIMQMMYRLRHDSTARIERTVGQRGTVYVPIPENHTGSGKIQIRTQGRIMEYAAKTKANEKLATGTTVQVTRVLSPMTLEVEPVVLDVEES